MTNKPLIHTSELTKTYRTGDVETHALAGATVDIDRGEFVSIMGPSGSGKSTFLHLVGFLDDFSSGSYIYDGKSALSYNEDEVANIRNKEFGFVFQAFNLLARTAAIENIKLPLLYSDVPESKWDKMAREALKSVGLEHRANHEPSELSGGEKQRVAIARALVNDPEVIFADEPTGNLDSKSGDMVMDIIRDLNREKKKTVIVITHDEEVAEQADRIVRIRDGKIESDEKVKKKK